MNELHPAWLSWLFVVFCTAVVLGCNHLANLALQKYGEWVSKLDGGISFSIRYWLLLAATTINTIISYSCTKLNEINFILCTILFTVVLVTIVLDFLSAKVIRSVIIAGIICGLLFAVSLGRGVEQFVVMAIAAACGFAFHYGSVKLADMQKAKKYKFGKGDILILLLAGSFVSLPDFLPVIMAGFIISIILGLFRHKRILSQFTRVSVAVGPGILSMAWLVFFWRLALI